MDWIQNIGWFQFGQKTKFSLRNLERGQVRRQRVDKGKPRICRINQQWLARMSSLLPEDVVAVYSLAERFIDVTANASGKLVINGMRCRYFLTGYHTVIIYMIWYQVPATLCTIVCVVVVHYPNVVGEVSN